MTDASHTQKFITCMNLQLYLKLLTFIEYLLFQTFVDRIWFEEDVLLNARKVGVLF